MIKIANNLQRLVKSAQSAPDKSEVPVGRLTGAGALMGGVPGLLVGGLGGMTLGGLMELFRDKEEKTYLKEMMLGGLTGAGLGGTIGALGGGSLANMFANKVNE